MKNPQTFEADINFDVRKKLIDDKIADIKEKTKPVSGLELMKYLYNEAPKMNDKERKELQDSIEKGFYESGRLLLDRAFTDGTLTEEEYLDMKNKFGLDITELSPILLAYYDDKDGYAKKGDKIVLMTVKHSPIYKNKEFLMKRFNITICCVEECIDMMKKDMSPKAFAEFEKLNKGVK